MNVLIVYAHPETHSLNATLNAFAVQHLESAGHRVQVSDLYAMNWKSQLDADDTLAPLVGDHFHPSQDSKRAFEQGFSGQILQASRRSYAGRTRLSSSSRCGGFRCQPS